MKKFNLLFVLLAFAGVTFLSSCEGETEEAESPKIVLSPNGDQSAIEGSVVTIELTLVENETSKSNLKTFAIDANGVAEDTTVTFSNNTSTASYTFTTVAPLAGQQNTVTFTLTDKAGETATTTVKITGTSSVTTTPLSSPVAFTWERCGGTGTGLAMFGLKWTSNGSGASAIIAEDADKLVVLTAAEWTSIVTQEDLIAAVDGATGVADYRGVSASASATYNDVLATKNGSDYYLINVTQAVVSNLTCGTNIKITGDYKN